MNDAAARDHGEDIVRLLGTATGRRGGGTAKVIAGGARTKTKAAASKAIGGASSGDAAIAKAAKKIEELAGSANRANRTILSELVGARSKAEKRAILSSN